MLTAILLNVIRHIMESVSQSNHAHINERGDILSENNTTQNQVKLLLYFSAVGIGSSFCFGLYNFVTGNRVIGLFEVFASLAGIANVLYYKKSLNYQLAVNLILGGMIILLLALFIGGGIGGTGIYWYYTFPPLAFFFQGRKKGFIWLGLLYFFTIAAYLFHLAGVIPEIANTFIEIRQLLASLLAVSLLLIFYEKVREENEIIIDRGQRDQLIKNIYDQQLEEAGQIQKNYIPHTEFKSEVLDITGYYKPAMEIGGDYFDFFQLSDGKNGFLLADVSSKGVPAALVMVKFRTIVKMLFSLKQYTPSRLFSEANRILFEENLETMFITAVYIVFDRKSKNAAYVNAGHQPLLYYSSKDQKLNTIKSKAIPLGVARKSKYGAGKLSIASGDIIVSYTDGITEMVNTENVRYGQERLNQVVMSCRDKNSQEISEAITRDVFSFNGKAEQNDDIATIVIKIK